MANIWVDGFEGYPALSQVYDLTANDISFNVGGGRGGGTAISMGTLGGNLPINISQSGGPVTELVFGYATKQSNSTQHWQLYNANFVTKFAYFSIDDVNRASLVFGYGVGGDILSPTLIPFRTFNVWRYYEHKIVLTAGGGGAVTIDYELRIDEQVIASVSGVSGPTTATSREFNILNISGGNNASVATLYDDLYINTLSGAITDDNDYWGDTRMRNLHPNGAVSADFTPSPAVANYLNVDDTTTDDDTTYNLSSTVGHKDTFEYEDTGLPAGTVIRTVAVMTTARREASSGPRELTSYVKHSATEVSGGVHQLSDTYYTVQFRVPQCPSTSAGWTPAEVDAARGSYSLTA